MNILVTGASGFVGVNLLERLLADGHSVVAVSASPIPDLARTALAALPGKLRIVQADVRDEHAIELLVSTAHVDAAFAGAAITSGPERERAGPGSIFDVNLAAPLHMVELAVRHGVGRVVLASSSAAMGDLFCGESPVREDDRGSPHTLYGIGKAALEAAVARWTELANTGPTVVIARPAAVFGPWERATGVRERLSPLHAIARAAVRGEPIAPLPADGVRDWVFAPYVADAIAWLLTAPDLQHRRYNLGGGSVWHPRELVGALADAGLPVVEADGGAPVPFHDDLPRRRRTHLDMQRLAAAFRAPPAPQAAAASFAQWVAAHREWFQP